MGMVDYSCNLTIPQAQTGQVPEVQDHPGLDSQFQVSLGYQTNLSCCKRTTKYRKTNPKNLQWSQHYSKLIQVLVTYPHDTS